MMTRRLTKRLNAWLLAGMLAAAPGKATRAQTAPTPDYQAYLFCYFNGSGSRREAVRFAVSRDGFHYHALNEGKPVIDEHTVSATGGMRDPHIYRGADGKTFFLVATDMNVADNSWGPNYGMVLMKSTDLIHWTSHQVNIPKAFPGIDKPGAPVNRVWAPQTIYDPVKKKYMVYWAMRFGNGPDKLYYAYANDAFSGLATMPRQLFYPPDGGACIDADIVVKDGKYHLFFKTEGSSPGIKTAVSNRLTGGYRMLTDRYLQCTDRPVEGSCTFKLNHSDTWVLMYDMYTSHRYQFTRSTDLKTFSPVEDISMDFHPRHGTVMSITAAELSALTARWPPAAADTAACHNPVIKGHYADPEILYARKTGRFYLYPTTDGFD